jgi:hypothetical protein
MSFKEEMGFILIIKMSERHIRNAMKPVLTRFSLRLFYSFSIDTSLKSTIIRSNNEHSKQIIRGVQC